MAILKAIFGDAHLRAARRLEPRVEEINQLEAEYSKMSDDDIRAQMRMYRESEDMSREYLHEILPRVFAIVREASRRTLHQRHFDVQLMGGMVLHEGKIAE